MLSFMEDLFFLPTADLELPGLRSLRTAEVAVLLMIHCNFREHHAPVSYLEVSAGTEMSPATVRRAVRSLLAARLLQAYKEVSFDSDSEGKRRARDTRRKQI